MSIAEGRCEVRIVEETGIKREAGGAWCCSSKLRNLVYAGRAEGL